jgi:hypothetical protein
MMLWDRLATAEFLSVEEKRAMLGLEAERL